MYFEQALTHLQSYFGYDSFRKGQEESIRYVLEGHNTACIMPTGEEIALLSNSFVAFRRNNPGYFSVDFLDERPSGHAERSWYSSHIY